MKTKTTIKLAKAAPLKTFLLAAGFLAGFSVGGIAIAGGGGGGATQSPMITKTAIDTKENTLIISGHHFGTASPAVHVAGKAWNVERFSDQEVVVALPLNLAAATYGITVTTSGRNRISSNLFSAALPDTGKN